METSLSAFKVSLAKMHVMRKSRNLKEKCCLCNLIIGIDLQHIVLIVGETFLIIENITWDLRRMVQVGHTTS